MGLNSSSSGIGYRLESLILSISANDRQCSDISQIVKDCA